MRSAVLALLLVAAAPSAADAATLVGAWSMEEDVWRPEPDAVADASAGHHPGLASGGATPVAGHGVFASAPGCSTCAAVDVPGDLGVGRRRRADGQRLGQVDDRSGDRHAQRRDRVAGEHHHGHRQRAHRQRRPVLAADRERRRPLLPVRRPGRHVQRLRRRHDPAAAGPVDPRRRRVRRQHGQALCQRRARADHRGLRPGRADAPRVPPALRLGAVRRGRRGRPARVHRRARRGAGVRRRADRHRAAGRRLRRRAGRGARHLLRHARADVPGLPGREPHRDPLVHAVAGAARDPRDLPPGPRRHPRPAAGGRRPQRRRQRDVVVRARPDPGRDLHLRRQRAGCVHLQRLLERRRTGRGGADRRARPARPGRRPRRRPDPDRDHPARGRRAADGDPVGAGRRRHRRRQHPAALRVHRPGRRGDPRRRDLAGRRDRRRGRARARRDRRRLPPTVRHRHHPLHHRSHAARDRDRRRRRARGPRRPGDPRGLGRRRHPDHAQRLDRRRAVQRPHPGHAPRPPRPDRRRRRRRRPRGVARDRVQHRRPPRRRRRRRPGAPRARRVPGDRHHAGRAVQRRLRGARPRRLGRRPDVVRGHLPRRRRAGRDHRRPLRGPALARELLRPDRDRAVERLRRGRDRARRRGVVPALGVRGGQGRHRRHRRRGGGGHARRAAIGHRAAPGADGDDRRRRHHHQLRAVHHRGRDHALPFGDAEHAPLRRHRQPGRPAAQGVDPRVVAGRDHPRPQPAQPGPPGPVGGQRQRGHELRGVRVRGPVQLEQVRGPGRGPRRRLRGPLPGRLRPGPVHPARQRRHLGPRRRQRRLLAGRHGHPRRPGRDHRVHPAVLRDRHHGRAGLAAAGPQRRRAVRAAGPAGRRASLQERVLRDADQGSRLAAARGRRDRRRPPAAGRGLHHPGPRARLPRPVRPAPPRRRRRGPPDRGGPRLGLPPADARPAAAQLHRRGARTGRRARGPVRGPPHPAGRHRRRDRVVARGRHPQALRHHPRARSSLGSPRRPGRLDAGGDADRPGRGRGGVRLRAAHRRPPAQVPASSSAAGRIRWPSWPSSPPILGGWSTPRRRCAPMPR
jgi:hypothetical protein